MSDQGFDFGPTPPRREARQFEPPPWERDQFERHKREQAEQEAAAEEARDGALAEDEARRVAEQAAAGVTREASAAQDAPRAAGEGVGAESTTPAPAAEVDEKQVAMMMLGLRAEEPPALEGVWAVNLAAGGVVALIGIASVIWGVAALARKGLPAAGTLGGVILLGFGLGFLGIGGWLAFNALRQRGVL